MSRTRLTERCYSITLAAILLTLAGTAFADDEGVETVSVAVENGGVEQNDEQSYLFRYKFTPGEELRYQTSLQVTQQTVLPAGQKVDVSSAEQKRVFRIGEVDANGDATATMQFEHVHMEMQVDDNEKIVFDSTMEPDAVPTKYRSVAKDLKSAAPTFTLKADGVPLSDEGVEEVPDSGTACFMIPLPDAAIKPGGFWSSKIPIDVRLAPGVMRKINLLRSYKLKSVNDGIAEIAFFTSVEADIKSPQVRALLLQTTPSGTISFDIQNGRVLRRELSFDRFVLGAMGANTMLTAKGKTVEQLLPNETVAQTDAPSN